MSTMEQFQRSIADHVSTVSSWRRARFDDDLRDTRNLRSADGLIEFREFILALPGDDERLTTLYRVAQQGDHFYPGQQTSYELGRFRFHDDTATCDGFLTYVVQLAIQDAGESGRFGGPQVPGDEPW